MVSKPARSSARAVATISSTGSMVSCMTPTRNGGDIHLILSDALRPRGGLGAAGGDAKGLADLVHPVAAQRADHLGEERLRHERRTVQREDALRRHSVCRTKRYFSANPADRSRRR